MAVVELYGSAAVDPAANPTEPIGAPKNARVRALQSTVEVGATDSTGSTYHMGKVPSNGRPLQNGSRLYGDAITATGGADLDFGDANDPNGLVAGADLATALAASALSAVDIDKVGKAFWEILGYTEDPGGELDLYLTLTDNANAAGTLSVELLYTVD